MFDDRSQLHWSETPIERHKCCPDSSAREEKLSDLVTVSGENRDSVSVLDAIYPQDRRPSIGCGTQLAIALSAVAGTID